ncbi:hypothetical protein CH338_30740, partial [Rhodoplanes elegans]
MSTACDPPDLSGAPSGHAGDDGPDDAAPLGDAEAAALFADLALLPALILAVSGGVVDQLVELLVHPVEALDVALPAR